MKKLLFSILAFLLFTLVGCKKETDLVESLEFNFVDNSEGWVGDFADYPNQPNVVAFYELAYSYYSLPSPLNSNKGSLRLSGNNHSDDLFMFVKKKIAGLKPNTTYKIAVEVEFATNAADGAFGVGGSPGESVYIKAGASTIEPMKVLDTTNNFYEMNIDKGFQSEDGTNMKVIGNFANGTQLNVYKLKILKTAIPINVISNSNGEIWIIVGTDSAFEATTTIYYNRISVSIE